MTAADPFFDLTGTVRLLTVSCTCCSVVQQVAFIVPPVVEGQFACPSNGSGWNLNPLRSRGAHQGRVCDGRVGSLRGAVKLRRHAFLYLAPHGSRAVRAICSARLSERATGGRTRHRRGVSEGSTARQRVRPMNEKKPAHISAAGLIGCWQDIAQPPSRQAACVLNAALRSSSPACHSSSIQSSASRMATSSDSLRCLMIHAYSVTADGE